MAFQSRRLRELLGAEIADLEYSHFVAIQGDTSAVEGDDLDWKVKYDDAKDKRRLEIAKDVASFANASGGLLVIGMAEDRSTSAPATIVDQPVTDRDEREFRQAVASSVFPLPDFSVYRLGNPTTTNHTKPSGIMLVAVPPSSLAPHAVLYDQRPGYSYPQRRGNKNEWLNEPQIATAYRERFAAAIARSERLDAIELESVQHFFEADCASPLLTISLVPDLPARFDINRDSFREVERAVLGPVGFGHNMQRTLAKIVVGPSRLQAVDGLTPPEAHYEFHKDGSGTCSVVPFTQPYNHDRMGGDLESGVVQIGMVHTHHVVAHVSNALLLLARHAVERCGSTGTAQVRVSLRASVFDGSGFVSQDPSEQNWEYDRIHLLAQHGHHVRIEGERSVEFATADSSCILTEMTDHGVGVTRAVAFSLSRTLQGFGVLETSQLREDGTVRVWAFPTAEEKWWQDWCSAHDVPFLRTGW